MAERRGERVFIHWAVLGTLLLALLVQALRRGREDWPTWVGDEATYLMAAQSLAWDFDLRYSREDYDRFRALTGAPPDGLILQSTDGGSTLLYAKPLLYPLYLAPFVRLGGIRGAVLGNVLVLGLAALASARTLARRLGPVAPTWVAVFVFASVAFAQVFWIHADLFYAGLVALALAQVMGRDEEQEAAAHDDTLGSGVRLGAAGALLAAVAFARPFYAPLLLPAVKVGLFRLRDLGRLLWPATAVVLVSIGINLAVRGTWSSYSGERQGFYAYTGFPLVDETASDWPERVQRRGPNAWTGPVLPFGFDLRLTLWNVIYLLGGRHIGLLPYFLPVVLALASYRAGGGRTCVLLAVGLGVLAFLLVRPFNFYGGGGALANRYFLPLYPALWFVVGRRARLLPALVVVLLAAPFLAPLWRDPGRFLRGTDGGYGYVSLAAQRWLPYETTQSHLKPSGGEDFAHHGLWIKPLSVGLEAGAGGETMIWTPPGRAALLVGSSLPLHELELTVRSRTGEIARPPLEIAGAEVEDRGAALRLRLKRPRARHPMWWTRDELYLYRLTLRPTSEVSVPLELELRRPEEPGAGR